MGTNRYAAFISYSSRDTVFAKRLHQGLERYKIPKALGRFDLIGTGSGNRIYPVFRDREELPSGDLDKALKSALDDSANLIVICSPDASASDWVNEEIRYFREIGKGDRIFPIIARTDDSLAGDTERVMSSMPASLNMEEGFILAGDARKDKDRFRPAMLKVIAGILGVNAGDLQNRDRRRRRQQSFIGSLASTAILAGAGIYLWGYVISHTVYAKDYVRVFGQPEPLFEIGKDAASRRASSYKFTSRGALRPFSRIDSVNAQGYCPTSGSYRGKGNFLSFTGDAFNFSCNVSRACRLSIAYENGEVLAESVIDQYGKVLEKITYDQRNQAARQEAVFGCSRLDNGIKFVKIDRAPEGPNRGKDIRRRFFENRQEVRPNKSRVYGYEMDYNSDGTRSEVRYLTAEGNVRQKQAGIGGTKYEWDAEGNNITKTSIDDAGVPMRNISEPAITQYTYDVYGNIIESQLFDVNGKPAFHIQGFNRAKRLYDEKGGLIKSIYEDKNGKPVTTSLGSSQVEYEVDEHGFHVGRSFFDEDGTPIIASLGYHREYSELDNYGATQNFQIFDIEGRHTRTDKNVPLFRNKHDDSGNRIESASFLADGTPIIDKSGVHKAIYEWNDLGQRIATRFYGTNGEPISDKQGKFELRSSFDSEGRWTKTRYFGIDGLPTRNNKQVFGFDYDVDDHDNVLRQIPVDAEGKVLDITKQHISRTYDELGRQITLRYLGPDGKVVALDGGTIEWRWIYADDTKNHIRVESFDADGKPTLGLSGSHAYNIDYDDFGRAIAYRYFGKSGEPVINSSGYSIDRREYNNIGQLVRRAFFDIEDKPIIGSDGWASRVYERNSRGKITEFRSYGVDGLPILDKRGEHGETKVYNDQGYLTEYTRRGLKWEPISELRTDVAIIRYDVDERGNRIQELYFDINGKPVGTPTGIYGARRSYNSRNQTIEKIHLGPNESIKDTPGQTMITQYEYDMQGHFIKAIHLDDERQPIADNRAQTLYTRDKFGNALKVEHQDKDGNPRLRSYTKAAFIRYDYNDRGQLLLQEYFGVDEEPVNLADKGWQKKLWKYSEHGAELSVTCKTVAGITHPCEP